MTLFHDMFIDRKFRLPRLWSNQELRKYAHYFRGDVVNVSGWKDEDKEEGCYRSYFCNAHRYYLTNFGSEAKGYQDNEGEILLDLEAELSHTLHERFDVVFNHTTLEHLYDCRTAFVNLCRMTRDIVILVVPTVQQMHGPWVKGGYGDYWRFTPLAVMEMFREQGLEVVHLSFNGHRNASVYTFAIASKHPERWNELFNEKVSCLDARDPADGFHPYAGCHVIANRAFRLKRWVRKFARWP